MSESDFESPQPEEFHGWRRWVRSIEAAAAAGILFGVAASASFAILVGLPGFDATERDIVEFYGDSSQQDRAILGLDLMVLAIVGLLWFIAVIRNRMGDREPKLFSTVFFGSGIIVAIGLLVGAATFASPSILAEGTGRVPELEVVTSMRALGITIFIGVVSKIQAMFVLSTGTLGLRTGIFSRWLVVLTVVVGLGLFINVTFFTAGFYMFPAWVVIVSIELLVRPRKL
jgi:hypothetical protein